MKRKTKKIIVNAMTFSRIIGTFLLPGIISLCGPIEMVAYISSLLLTDFIDGKLARKWDVSTVFGATLDAFSDKLFGISLLIYLVKFYPVIWLTIINELIIAGCNLDGLRKGVDIKSSKIGKFKTGILDVTSALAILSTIIPSFSLQVITYSFCALTLASQAAAFVDYKSEIEKQYKSNGNNKESFKKVITDIMENAKDKEKFKEILFSTNYFKQNEDKPLLEKLTEKDEKNNNENYHEEIKVENLENNKEINQELTIEEENKLKIEFNLNEKEIEKIKEYLKLTKCNKESLEKAIKNIIELEKSQDNNVIETRAIKKKGKKYE